MILHLPVSVRGVLVSSLIVIGLGIYGTMNNSKTKAEYDMATGTIEYLDKTYKNHTGRDGYRYLKVDCYTYPFEIYKGGSKPTEKNIDDLKVGDRIDIYFYETSSTRSTGVNNFTQYIDKDRQPYFVRNGFQKQLGYVIICAGFLLQVMAFGLWKIGKLKW